MSTAVEPDMTDLTIQCREDLNDALETLSLVNEELESEESKQERRVRKARQRNADEIDDLQEAKDAIEEEITEFAVDNKDDLLEGTDGKTAQLPSGDIQYREGKPTVTWDDKQEAIKALKDSGNDDLVVVRETLHKSVLKKHEDVVRSISQLEWVDAEDNVVIKPL